MTTPPPDSDLRVGVVGGGSWGTALANLLGGKGIAVDLWVLEEAICEQITRERENGLFLPGVGLSPNISASNDLARVVADKPLVLLVVPSHVMRPVSLQVAANLTPGTVVVTASKGIENDTLLTMAGVLQETLTDVDPDRLAALSGPSFAKEVAAQVPTAVSAASRSLKTAEFVQQVFATPYFRVYTSDDVVGVELGGAVKNVVAIASGMIDGLALGLNTRAALITRGLAEIRRLGVKMGARPMTFAGLAGIGDLILTCTGDLSRNYTVGKQIGQGLTLEEILGQMHMVAEGVKNAESVYHLSLKQDVEMPIAHEVYRILYEAAPPLEAVQRLMTRDLKPEIEPHEIGGL